MLDPMARRTSEEISTDLRARLETARLDLLALFRALDRMHLTPQQIPQLPAACSRFRKNLPVEAHALLSRLELTIRTNLNPAEVNTVQLRTFL